VGGWAAFVSLLVPWSLSWPVARFSATGGAGISVIVVFLFAGLGPLLSVMSELDRRFDGESSRTADFRLGT